MLEAKRVYGPKNKVEQGMGTRKGWGRGPQR